MAAEPSTTILNKNGKSWSSCLTPSRVLKKWVCLRINVDGSVPTTDKLHNAGNPSMVEPFALKGIFVEIPTKHIISLIEINLENDRLLTFSLNLVNDFM